MFVKVSRSPEYSNVEEWKVVLRVQRGMFLTLDGVGIFMQISVTIHNPPSPRPLYTLVVNPLNGIQLDFKFGGKR